MSVSNKKQRVAPVNKNDDITVSIDTLNSAGQGVGRVDGYAVFVPGALPNETVRAHIIKAGSSYAAARLMAIEKESPDRVKPVCPRYGACGGCALQHLSYPAQLEFKRRLVSDAVVRIGGFTEIEVPPVIGMDAPVRYRNKGSFPIGSVDGRAVFGFYAERSHRIIPLDDCLIQHESIVSIPRAVCEWADRYGVKPYDEESKKGVLRHVMARMSERKDVMAVVITTGALPYETELIRMLRAAGAKTAVHNINSADTNVILGPRFRTLYGPGTITDNILGSLFRVSAAAFLQVNHEQTERLYSLAIEKLALSGKETVVDVYCGMGSISLNIAGNAKKVIGIENVEPAVKNARENASLNGVDNAEFILGDAETVLPRLVRDGLRPDAVLVDPPRRGCDEYTLKAIADCGAKRLVYVSCDPATLARDMKFLAGEGFAVEYIQSVDMFPQTSHVESVVLMTRKTETQI